MRTTLDLDEDVLLAAKSISSKKGATLGKVISELVRKALAPKESPSVREGVPVFPRQKEGKIVTLEMVNRLREETE